MVRSNWKGVISFGLVTIPIMLYPSKNKHAEITFHQIDKRDNARIQYQRINSNTGKIVAWDNITRGYEFDKETTIPVPDDVLLKVAGDKARTINIETFVDREDVNLLTLENVYFLVPDKNGQKGYVILREALNEMHKAAVAKVVISTKEYVAVIITHEHALMLCLLRYDNEVKKSADFDLPTKNITAYKITAKEIEVAKKLIKAMSSKWKPEKFTDEYQEAIHRWVAESAKNLPHQLVKKIAKKPAHAVSFIDLLKKSLQVSTKTKTDKTIKHTVHLKAHKLNKHSTKKTSGKITH